jgi:CBS domain containing-hemolysin-like protein
MTNPKDMTTDINKRPLLQKVRGWLGGKPKSEALREAVEDLIEEPSTETGIPPSERLLLANILTIREQTAEDCMVPRANIDALPVTADIKELVALMNEEAHSRVPIYRDTLDDVLGMVHMKDVVAALAGQQDISIRTLLRPVLFVAPSTPALKLLLQMRQTRQHMALVVDEFGGIDGLVTIEDLVEEIIGEIEDEHDDIEPPYIMVRSDGNLLVDARLGLDDFEEKVGPFLSAEEREEIDTLGGYLFILAGKIPHVGDVIKHDATGMEFEILESDHNRIKRVRVRHIPALKNTSQTTKEIL